MGVCVRQGQGGNTTAWWHTGLCAWGFEAQPWGGRQGRRSRLWDGCEVADAPTSGDRGGSGGIVHVLGHNPDLVLVLVLVLVLAIVLVIAHVLVLVLARAQSSSAPACSSTSTTSAPAF